MPRQKKTDQAPVVDIELLEPLTDDERRFVELQIRDGIGPSEAFRQIWGQNSKHGDEKDEHAHRQRAYRLNSSSRIQAYRSALYQAGAKTGLMEQQEFVRDMLALADRSERAGNYGAAVNARNSAAKASGLFIEQFKDVSESTDVHVLLDQIEELAGPEARAKAAARLGVVDEPGGEPDTRH